MRQVLISVGLWLFVSNTGFASNYDYPKTEEELLQAYQELSYHEEPRTYRFESVNQQFELPAGWILFQGEDARRFLFLNNGTSSFEDVQAVVIDEGGENQVIFSYVDSGYVEDSDWSKLDSKALLEGIREGTEDANIERQKNGVPPLNITGWEQLPDYDANTRTAYWAVGAESEGISLSNAIAIKLGRHGFTKVIWVTGEVGDVMGEESMLAAGLRNHSFAEGFKYDDFSTGDKLAGIGLASLVAVTAGSKNGKGVAAGILATLLLLAKKFWFVLLMPLVFIRNKIGKMFGSKQ